MGGAHRQPLERWSRRTLAKGLDDVLAHLKDESERRAAPT